MALRKRTSPEELPYGTKIFYNGRCVAFAFWGPKHDYVERIEVETEPGTANLTKIALLGRNEEKVTLNVENNKVVSIDFKKKDGREFHQNIPE